MKKLDIYDIEEMDYFIEYMMKEICFNYYFYCINGIPWLDFQKIEKIKEAVDNNRKHAMEKLNDYQMILKNTRFEDIYYLNCEEIIERFLCDDIDKLIYMLRKGNHHITINTSVSDNVLKQWIALKFKNILLDDLNRKELEDKIILYSFSDDSDTKIYTSVTKLYKDYLSTKNENQKCDVYEWKSDLSLNKKTPAEEFFQELFNGE